MCKATALASEVGIRADLKEQPIWRVLLHRQKLAQAIYRLVTVQIFKSAIDPRLRELAILRIAWRTASELEWAQHWRFAITLGLPEPDLVAVRDWREYPSFDERDQAVLAATDDVVELGWISDERWLALSKVLSADEVIDISFAIMTWSFVSSLLRTFSVPLPDHMDPWLPDGREPP
jgi:alkylhydroperoxidase family enzyme